MVHIMRRLREVLYSYRLDSRHNAVEDKVVMGFGRRGDLDLEKEMAEKEKETSE